MSTRLSLLCWMVAGCAQPQATGGGPDASRDTASDGASRGALGTSPLPDSDLHAGAYVLDLGAARFTAPPGVADLLIGELDLDPTLQVVASGPGGSTC